METIQIGSESEEEEESDEEEEIFSKETVAAQGLAQKGQLIDVEPNLLGRIRQFG